MLCSSLGKNRIVKVTSYENGELKSFFTSEYCLMRFSDLWQMIKLAFTVGYLTFDILKHYLHLLFQNVHIHRHNYYPSKESSKFQTQTYIHHFVGIIGFISAITYCAGGALIVAVYINSSYNCL